MKRDFDLIRELLIGIEALPPDEPSRTIPMQRDDWDDEILMRHIEILIDSGYVKGKMMHGHLGAPIDYVVFDLSMEGHDFLDAIRNDTVWTKTKEKLAEVGGSAALEVVKKLAVSISAKLLGI